ncbi:hypothetical protein C0993_010217, partial [Termitomyces sp. T159_Od127]
MEKYEALIAKYEGPEMKRVPLTLQGDEKEIIPTGRLVHLNADGNILNEAQKIIYPGSNGDAWWDAPQLLEQVKHTMV